MILVTTGTNGASFGRLLDEVESFVAEEEVVVQHGPSPVRPRGARCVEYLPFDELMALMAAARVVVTHAGVGSVLAAIENGHRPLVVPRRAEMREAVDDHQVFFARRLAREGMATVVDDPGRLGELVRADTRCDVSGLGGGTLSGELSRYLRSV